MTVYQIYRALNKSYGPQYWWPAVSSFEVMIGAILTQNTSWTNVEKAIATLKLNNALEPDAILRLRKTTLAKYIKSSGYFNVKAERLKNFCQWYSSKNNLELLTDENLRSELLSVNGIGPETADDILLYAFNRPVFVIDAYTKRIFNRLGFVMNRDDYESWRLWFEKNLSKVKNKVSVFNQYHALLVHHAKNVCKAKQPACAGCCIEKHCEYREVST